MEHPQKMKKIDHIIRYAETSEKAIEKYLSERVKEIGGLSLKFTNQNMVGFPDRLICLPGGKTVWVELKSKGKKPTKIQILRQEELAGLGFDVYIIDNKPAIDELINHWRI